MRKILLAGVAVAVLAATGAPRPAHALLGAGDVVIDPTAIAKLADQLRNMEQQYAQLQQTYQALAHLTSVNGVASQLGIPSTQNPMGAVSRLPGLLNGTNLGGTAQQFLNQNRYYQPQGNDFAAQEMQRRAQSTANIQAIAQENLEATEARMSGLQELQTQIDASPTTQDMGAIQARLGAEGNFIQTQQAQAAQLQVLQRAQEQASQQRAAEWQRQSAEGQFNATRPMSGGSGTQGGQGTASATLDVPTFQAGGPGS
jgi:type IV secretion system protein VirB5